MTEDIKFYTVKEAVEATGWPVHYFYRAIKEKKLHPISDPYKGYSGHLITEEELARFIEQYPMKQQTGTFSATQAAKQLQVNRLTVDGYIKEGILPVQSLADSKGKATAITEEDLHTFQERYAERLLADRLMQRHYYNKKKNEAAYQRFSSESVPEARLMREGKGDWYFLIPDTGEYLEYEEGIYKHQLKPDYPIDYGRQFHTKGYSTFKLPAEAPLTYRVIDLIYKEIPLANVYVLKHGDSLLLKMKDAVLKQGSEEIYRYLSRCVESGRVNYDAKFHALSIESGEEPLSVHVPTEVKDWIKEQAEQTGSTIQDIARDMMIAQYKSVTTGQD